MRYLKKQPDSFAWKIHGSAYSHGGMPDIFFLQRGRLWFFEVKRPGGPGATPLQKETIAMLEKAGARCFVVRSLKEIKKEVNKDEKDY